MALQRSPGTFMSNGGGSRYQAGAMSTDSGWQSRAAQGAGEVGAAAGMSTLADVAAITRKNSPNYGSVAQMGMKARSAMRQSAMKAEADVASAGITAVGNVRAAEIRAEAAKEAAQAGASGSMMGSAFGAIGSIGAALLSDETTKNTVEKIDDALGILRGLRPVSFYYNEEYTTSPERLHYGFIAQEYKDVMPYATYYDGELGKMCIDTAELIGLLVRSVQQLETRITRMEAANALVGVK